MADPAIYRAFFDELDDAVAVLDPKTGRYEAVNPAYATLFQREPGELEGKRVIEHVNETLTLDRDAVTAALEVARRGDSRTVRGELDETAGGPRSAEVELAPFESKEIESIRATVRLRSASIDEGTRDDELTNRLAVALEGTNTGVWELDLESGEMAWTNSAEELFGVEPETFDDLAERIHPDDLPTVERDIEQAIERGDVFQTEHRVQHENGEETWVLARGEVRSAQGNAHLVGMATDITSKKAQEQALVRQEHQYRELVDRLPEAYYTFDRNWTMTYCNDVIADRFDTPAEQLIGQTVWDAFPEIRGTVLEETFRTVMETDEPASCEYHVESRGFWVDIQAYPYEDGIAIISSDVTEQKRKLSLVLDSLPLVFYQIDADRTFLESRGKGLAELGLERDEVVGESVFDIFAKQPSIVAAIERAFDGEAVSHTTQIGTNHFLAEYRPVVENGAVTNVIGAAMDVTELERQREQMEFFNSILRHDVLNGMTVIKARGEILAAELDGDLGQYARTIVDWCTTTTEVTQRVQRVVETLTTPEDSLQLDSVDVSAILDRKLSELQTANPRIEFERDVAPGIEARADELLSEVLGNVLLNAIEHNDTDDLTIDVTAAVDDEVTIRITDDGGGIDDDRKESVFRRGETSHAKETGSGFGLFFVDVMVDKYGGEAWVEDAESGGACFVLELPRATTEAQG
ncbi:PAS domain S-box [Halovivax ruber XH-70]|uniref:histidine kinase n=1 Tax=Halovivax ruber (strain DSM 18193 / JCM 13892 / XH-70) TaxID=797302 RepID=L0IA45_HALRX|nr:PAS domain-containing sensor histidine kinase [Halovivax ruber]AGB14792.1 PAS domain S-box [Halovivax ruber XH-70]